MKSFAFIFRNNKLFYENAYFYSSYWAWAQYVYFFIACKWNCNFSFAEHMFSFNAVRINAYGNGKKEFLSDNQFTYENSE